MPNNERRPQFWLVAMRSCVFAAIIDVALFVIFYLLESPLLAWINVASIAMYIGAYYAFKHRKGLLGAGLFWAEVLIHAGVGIIAIGWESGFYYYLLIFIPVLCLTTSPRKAIAGLLMLWGYYVSLLLLMWSIEPVQPISETALRWVYGFNLSVVFALFGYLAFYYLGVITRAQKKLRQYAATDSLTGLFNRRYMTELTEKEISLSERSKRPLSFLLLDIDHFKSINDTYGHDVGDIVLKGVADVLEQQLRKQDLVARWGGEEFLVALPDTNLDKACASGERIRDAVMDADWQTITGKPINLTVSIGASQLREDEGLNAGVSRSDEAMYRSKASGRNTVLAEGA
jgi:diguanylate cyclase (GGDEF)-like protein